MIGESPIRGQKGQKGQEARSFGAWQEMSVDQRQNLRKTIYFAFHEPDIVRHILQYDRRRFRELPSINCLNLQQLPLPFKMLRRLCR